MKGAIAGGARRAIAGGASNQSSHLAQDVITEGLIVEIAMPHVRTKFPFSENPFTS